MFDSEQVEPLDHTVELIERIRAEPVAGGESGAGGAVTDGAHAAQAERAPLVGAAGERTAVAGAERASERVSPARVTWMLSRRDLAVMGITAAVVAGVAVLVAIWLFG